MRLIDADALREQTVKDAKFAEKNGFMDLKFEREWLVGRIDNQPTVCDIEQIKAEIYHACCMKYQKTCEIYQKAFKQIRADIVALLEPYGYLDYVPLDKVLQIIDKYTKGEQE